jgi:vacuolar-type H+-ATPase subunit E/Vma4
LPETDIGGIILTSFFGKIVCSNTLKARLDYAVQQALPDVRKTLFTT